MVRTSGPGREKDHGHHQPCPGEAGGHGIPGHGPFGGRSGRKRLHHDAGKGYEVRLRDIVNKMPVSQVLAFKKWWCKVFYENFAARRPRLHEVDFEWRGSQEIQVEGEMKGKKIIACVLSLAMMVCSFGMLSVAGAAESEDIPSTTTGHVSYYVSGWAISILPFYDNEDLKYSALANVSGYISVDGSDRTRLTGNNKLVADVGDIHAYYSVRTDGNDVWVTFNAVNTGSTSHSVKLGSVLDSVLCDVDYSNGVLTFDRHGQSGQTNPYLYTYRISSDDPFDTCYLGEFYTSDIHVEENSIVAHVFENSNITSLKITDFAGQVQTVEFDIRQEN